MNYFESRRSRRKFLGVCAWLADKLDFDVTPVRIIFVVATFFGVGSPILIYLILALVKPGEY